MSLSKQVESYWNAYLRQLDVNPVQTKALTSAVLSVVSDVLAQSLQGVPLSQLNTTSLRNQFIIGLLIRGPLVHYWYIILEKLFIKLGYSPKQQNATVPALLKVLLDQTIFSFPFNLLYFYALGLLEGRSLDYIHAKIDREFMPMMISNLKLWPLVNVLNFTVIPENLRVLFGNIVGIFWTVYVIRLTSGK